MDNYTKALQLLLLFLLNPGLRDCYILECHGEVTVDQDIIPIGSNLTIHCRSDTVKCGQLFIMTLEEKEILRRSSCSSVTVQVVLNEPKSSIVCGVEEGKYFHIVCGLDIIANHIPSTPYIKEIIFAKGSLSPIIHWHRSDEKQNLKPRLRLKMDNASEWKEGNVTQLHRGTLVLLEELEPLTKYHFELRVCAASVMYNCSLWSELFTQESPGKAPSTKLDVWRIIMRNEQSDTQNVTVMWRPLGSEDYKADLYHYEIVYQEKGITYIMNCSTTVTKYTLQLPLEVTELNVSAVTSAGSSPPASVRLTCSAGLPSPEINSSYAAEGVIKLVWDSPDFSKKTSDHMLGFIVQCQCTPLEVQWERIKKTYNSIYIQVAQSPVCNISLYVESRDGVSCPHVKQISMTPKGTDTSPTDLLPENPKNGLLVWICLTISVPIIILVNLMYLKCTRQRIRKTFVSVGPSWLFQNLPKLDNSNAIKLLQDERCHSDVCWQPIESDPPLSPIEDYSPPLEREESYPIVHKDVITPERTIVQDLPFCPYKPQITISLGADAMCDVEDRDEDESPWMVFSTPVFNTFEPHFLPSQRMQATLPSCLTVDGRPVSIDLADGFNFFTQTSLDGNMWTDGKLEETGSGDQNQQQSQTVLPSDLMRCLTKTFFNDRPPFTGQRSEMEFIID